MKNRASIHLQLPVSALPNDINAMAARVLINKLALRPSQSSIQRSHRISISIKKQPA